MHRIAMIVLCALALPAGAQGTGAQSRQEREEAKKQPARSAPAPAAEQRREHRPHRNETSTSSTGTSARGKAGDPPAGSGQGAQCSAQPQCTMATGAGNACRGVQNSYTGSDAMNTGLQDIVHRCRAANLPDPCGADVAGDPSGPHRHRQVFGGGCFQQCAAVAQCKATSAARSR
jgi:hypothetical protein